MALGTVYSPLDDSIANTTRRPIPAWLLSFLLHFLTLGLCAYTIQEAPRGIAGVEPAREAGIVLVSSSHGKVRYLEESDSAEESLNANPTTKAVDIESSFPDSDLLPGSSGPQLPSDKGVGAAVGLPGGESAPGANSFKGIGKSGSFSKRPGGKAQLQVFGVQGEGSKFVYVFDRSSSMEGSRLATAKRELIASLESLDKIHEFQIVFYNQEPRLMQLVPGQKAGMVFADERGKKLAESFVGSILADGATRHMEALTLALRMHPDVIFFLTDADDPKLSDSELKKLSSINHGTSINAIEFGSGPPSPGNNFLKRLAKENGGNYGYVDVTTFRRS